VIGPAPGGKSSELVELLSPYALFLAARITALTAHLGLPCCRVNERSVTMSVVGFVWKVTRLDEISGMHVRIDWRGRKIRKH
jgi:hypothetical protein